MKNVRVVWNDYSSLRVFRVIGVLFLYSLSGAIYMYSEGAHTGTIMGAVILPLTASCFTVLFALSRLVHIGQFSPQQ